MNRDLNDDGWPPDLLGLDLFPAFAGEGGDPGAQMRGALRENGYAHVRRRLPFSSYERLVRGVGAIASRADIRVDPEREAIQQTTRRVKARPSAYRAEALGFHSDNPLMDVLAWYCVAQDEADGAVQLVDTGDVAEAFSPDELSVLCAVELRYSHRLLDSEEEQFLVEPLVSRRGRCHGVYYQPWLLGEPATPEQGAAVEAFAAYVERKRLSGPITVQLEPGACLFIDNRRMLHGREALAADSKRHLIRFFVQTGGSLAEPS